MRSFGTSASRCGRFSSNDERKASTYAGLFFFAGIGASAVGDFENDLPPALVGDDAAQHCARRSGGSSAGRSHVVSRVSALK